MAIAYHNGTSSFAAANWSDTTGFAAAAQLVVNKAVGVTITGGLNQSAVSIEYLDVRPSFYGFIGAAGDPLICDVDGTSYDAATRVSRINYNAGGGKMYFNAGGGNTLAHIIECRGAGEFFFVAGILNQLVVTDGGRFVGNQTVTYSDTGTLNLGNGTSYIDTHASDLIGAINVTGGNHTIKRGGVATTGRLTVSGGTVTLDCDGGAWPEIHVHGGRLNVISIGAPDTNAGDVTIDGGIVDFTKLNRAVTLTSAIIAPGATLLGANTSLLTFTTPILLGGGGTNTLP